MDIRISRCISEGSAINTSGSTPGGISKPLVFEFVEFDCEAREDLIKEFDELLFEEVEFVELLDDVLVFFFFFLCSLLVFTFFLLCCFLSSILFFTLRIRTWRRSSFTKAIEPTMAEQCCVSTGVNHTGIGICVSL